MNLRFLFFAFLVSILSSSESLAGRNHSLHSASAEAHRGEPSIWTASPQHLNKETLFFLMIQLAEMSELLHSSENSGFFNPLIHQRLVVKPSLLPARSVELKTTSVRGYTISLGKHSGDFDFFRKRMIVINRLLEFLEEFIRRDGSIFSYLSLSDSAHEADSAPFLREVNAARLPEPVAFVVYLYLLKTQQLNLPNNLASDPSETERAQARPTFKNIISTRVIRRFFDPNLFWSKTSEVRGILEFYQQVLESLNHGGITSAAVAHRVWFSPDVDRSTRISVIQEMIDRIQTELSIRKFLAPHR